jgi:hypothetical protein
MLGVVEARGGDRQEALRIGQQIEALDCPYAFGDDTRWRARIAAQLGQHEQAISLLRQAFADGLAYGSWLHADMDLEPLSAHPAFQELLKPKG